MLRKKSSPALPADNSGQIDTLIGLRARFKGNLAFEGAVRIDGKFEGNIKAVDGSTLIISEAAEIKGEINVPNLMLHGTVNGNIRAAESIQISSSGRLNGDLEYAVLSLAEGASVNGRCGKIEEKKAVKKGAESSKHVSGIAVARAA